jgi:PAS domain S-box-containing protein
MKVRVSPLDGRPRHVPVLLLLCATGTADNMTGSAWRTFSPCACDARRSAANRPRRGSPREAYLRRVIERQPVCLARIASDGTFLAVNDATLALLGAAQLDEMLETSLLALVAPEHRDQCRPFLARIIAGDRGSTEVDLTALGGLRYTLQIHAVSLRSVSDSLASALCTFWDVTGHRRLERALTEAAAHGEQQAGALAAGGNG